VLATTALMSSVAADAQIVYVDLNPDFSAGWSSMGTHDVDLNNDGIFDFTFENHFNLTSFNPQHGSSAYANWIVLNPHAGNSAGLNPLDSGVQVNSTLSDLFSAAFTLAFCGQVADEFGTTFQYSGAWRDQYEKFMGVRFIIKGEPHYGWIRLSVNSHANNYILHDYAYEIMPDLAIAAGDIGCLRFFVDNDHDGFGASDDKGAVFCFNPGADYSLSNTDCNDANANIYSGAAEITGNNIDDDCNGFIDENAADSLNDDLYTLSVFPNPTWGRFAIALKLLNKITAEAQIEVTSLLSHFVHSQIATMENGKLQEEIQLSDAAEGIYLVKVTIGDHAYTAQINLEK
jgi:hypothetical protein